MHIDYITIFPEAFDILNLSIIKRAQEKGLFSFNAIDLRDFTKDKHQRVDDKPYGGGPGMLMTPQPIFDAVKSVKREDSKVILTSAAGKRFNQGVVQEMVNCQHLIIICGFYEGIDFRVNEALVDYELSVGDYILTNGNLAAIVMTDAIVRLQKGVLGNEFSTIEDSFTEDVLEAPQYTRPENFEGMKVPEVLLSGNHGDIKHWRLEKAKERTEIYRPDFKEDRQ